MPVRPLAGGAGLQHLPVPDRTAVPGTPAPGCRAAPRPGAIARCAFAGGTYRAAGPDPRKGQPA
ncbi:hypothetical protein [Streptomyces sp. NRRL B-3648]|uniref:hypothetical protein n=1 Tax=Streptomyces sp. NRRL B-3648 TaxID=1519493 RepID=UPI0006B02CEC|nr:hypothetical protein [Streptomyces sp. NRRL B-3648]KOX02402.1 hypothetical protein ADL04_12175 [Streptomyces sp. NRRL B-3648]